MLYENRFRGFMLCLGFLGVDSFGYVYGGVFFVCYVYMMQLFCFVVRGVVGFLLSFFFYLWGYQRWGLRIVSVVVVIIWLVNLVEVLVRFSEVLNFRRCLIYQFIFGLYSQWNLGICYFVRRMSFFQVEWRQRWYRVFFFMF